RFRRAATAGGVPAGRSSAAPHRAKVQAGGDGGSGPREAFIVSPCAAGESGAERRRPIPSRRREGAVSARPDHRRRAGGAGRPAHLLGGPNDVYRRVAAPQGPTPPPRSPTVTGRGALRREDSGIPPPVAPPRFPDPSSPFSGRPRSSITGPIKAARALGGPIPARDARPDVTEATWRCAGHSPTPSLSVFAQARGVSVVSGRPASAPGRRGRGPPPRRTRPPPPTHGRPRRQFEPPPRETPHSAEAPAPPLPLPLLPG